MLVGLCLGICLDLRWRSAGLLTQIGLETAQSSDPVKREEDLHF